MWNLISINDVQNEILPDEVALINTVEGSTTVLPIIIADVVAEIEGNILACGQQIDQPGLVPDQVRTKAKDIIRWRWFCALPKTGLQSEFRKAQNDKAETFLETLWEKIRAGTAKIEIPANPQTNAGPANRLETVRPGNRPQDWGDIGHS
jgi:hypothetical protein